MTTVCVPCAKARPPIAITAAATVSFSFICIKELQLKKVEMRIHGSMGVTMSQYLGPGQVLRGALRQVEGAVYAEQGNDLVAGEPDSPLRASHPCGAGLRRRDHFLFKYCHSSHLALVCESPDTVNHPPRGASGIRERAYRSDRRTITTATISF